MTGKKICTFAFTCSSCVHVYTNTDTQTWCCFVFSSYSLVDYNKDFKQIEFSESHFESGTEKHTHSDIFIAQQRRARERGL